MEIHPLVLSTTCISKVTSVSVTTLVCIEIVHIKFVKKKKKKKKNCIESIMMSVVR